MRGVAAPAGLPREVLDRLVAAVRQAMENDEFRQLAAQQALPLRFLDPDAYRTELFGLAHAPPAVVDGPSLARLNHPSEVAASPRLSFAASPASDTTAGSTSCRPKFSRLIPRPLRSCPASPPPH